MKKIFLLMSLLAIVACNEKIANEEIAPVELKLVDVTATTVTFTGHLDVPVSDLSSHSVSVYYSDVEPFDRDAAECVFTTLLDKGQNFIITLTNLKCNTKYNYICYYDGPEGTYCVSTSEFITLQYPSHPYEIQQDLDMSSATDLSSSASANCYIVSESGLYKFKTVKGNSSESVGSVASASILWETFGTSESPEYLDLIKAFCYKDDYIAFSTADTFREGNAVIAAKDVKGNILWSWHIWLTDQPEEHVYKNDAGTMMDRNLGATSATPGDVGALGLLYQWGRKDPFLGSSFIHYNQEPTIAKSTIIWPSKVSTTSDYGTIEYATAHPTVFITAKDSSCGDWYYTGSLSMNNTRWTTFNTSKSIYDPCPAGWRVPDGGDPDGVWAKAGFNHTATYDHINEGISFSISSPSTTWYPGAGFLNFSYGCFDVTSYGGYYWSATPNQGQCCELLFGDLVYLMYSCQRAAGLAVRCIQVID